jgi:hypothetical protein
VISIVIIACWLRSRKILAEENDYFLRNCRLRLIELMTCLVPRSHLGGLTIHRFAKGKICCRAFTP